MGSTIPAVVANRGASESTRIVQHDPYHPRTSAYGSTAADEVVPSKSRSRLSSGNFSITGVTFEEDEREGLNDIEEEEESEDGLGMPIVDCESG